MTPWLRDPNLLLAALLAGLALGSLEFLRPGWVVPGVLGATITMLAIAGLSHLPLNRLSLLLLLCALFLSAAALLLHWNVFASFSAAILAAVALRLLIDPPALPVHWTIACLGGLLLLAASRLAAFAVQARANKMT